MKKKDQMEDLRLDPEKRICPIFDKESIAMFALSDPLDCGRIVQDNCAEEHIM